MMQFDKSLISRRNSSMLKGMLILLIIIGHNGILMGKAPGLTVTTFNNYLYCFHVYLFLILPFLYNIPKFTKTRLKKDFRHIYKSYTFMFVALLFINIVLLKQQFEILPTLYAYISGNELLLRNTIGASFLWFMPVMFTLLIFRNLILTKRVHIIYVATIISALLFLATKVLHIISIYDCPYFVMGGMVATAYFYLAVIGRYIYETLSTKNYFYFVSIFIFVTITIIYYCNILTTYKYLQNFLYYAILPLSVMYTFIYIIQHINNSYIEKIFTYLGNESLPIYMIHVFVYNTLLRFIQKMHLALDFTSGIITLILTIIITILIIYICKKMHIYKFLFQ